MMADQPMDDRDEQAEARPASGGWGGGVAEPEQPRRKRRWPKVLGWLVVLLVVAVLGYGGFIGYSLAKISTRPLDLSGLSTDAAGRSNVLVLGQGDPGHSGAGLTDTMMMVSLDTKGQRVAEISVPRDLQVSIPGHGTGKINSANAYGGTTLAAQTVSNTLGVPVNYFVSTDFTGLRQVVDAVGGIDVDVKTELKDTEYPCDDNQYKVCGLDIKPGLQHMNGTVALQYARCRKGTCGNDFGRAARQQEVLNLVRARAVQWSVVLNPTKLLPMVTAVRDNVQTNLGALQLMELAWSWQRASANKPVSLVLSTSEGGYLRSSGTSTNLLPIGGDFSAIDSRVQNIFSATAINPDTP